jgi:hypothetical protein
LKKLSEVLENKHDNYIFPLFWLHGEDENILRMYIKKMYEVGIKGFVVESRPHPDFLGKKWWEDMDIIIEEAKKYNMKVWLLDDSHFPTGYANGRVKKDYPQYLKKFLKIHQLDYVGPLNDATCIVKWGSPNNKFSLDEKMTPYPDKILKIIAAKKTGSNSMDATTFLDITEFHQNGLLHWNIPDGHWRIFVLLETTGGGEPHTEGYLNPLDSRATRILIDEIYEPHYERYKEEFGKTFAGFFSDEPRFGNIHGSEGSIGRKEMVYPWRDGMLEEFFKEDYLYLPLLEPIEAGGKEKEIRYKYMDIVSKEYSKCFTQVLADWCHEKNVEYIGHLLEDNNSHARLGYGAGHFYRAIAPQDMAGIDVVLNQIMPGMDQNVFKSMTKLGWDGEFFHYGLAKMGTSLGHLDSKKKGRTFCEVFGAYGWAEGLSLMKFIADHMLVRGVNHFVPHAFNPNPFPDPDCPPHFYANGHDPEYRYMGILFNYMNRMSHLLNGGKHIARVGLLYHAEAEWLGNYMLFQKPARVLMQHQIDFDVIPIDYIMSAALDKNRFVINNETFDILVIPYAEALPDEFLKKVRELAENGITVYFIDDYPSFNEKNERIDQSFLSKTYKIPLEQLGVQLKNHGTEFTTKTYEPYLRYYHYQQPDGNIYMFFNEDPYKKIETTAILDTDKELVKYDAFMNEIVSFDQEHENHQVKFALHLYPNESLILIDKDHHEVEKNIPVEQGTKRRLDLMWTVEFAKAEDYPVFKNRIEINELMNINKIKGMEFFAGFIKYTSFFDMVFEDGEYILDLGTVNEIAEVFINDRLAGAKICYPYQFSITNYLKSGQNKIEIIVVNNLGIQEQDYLSQYIPLRPAGMLGPVQIIHIKRAGC